VVDLLLSKGYVIDFFASLFVGKPLNILIYCFTIDTSWEKWLQTNDDIIFEVITILKKNHLEFAYPSMSLYHEKN